MTEKPLAAADGSAPWPALGVATPIGRPALDQPAFRWTRLNAGKVISFKKLEHLAPVRTQEALAAARGAPAGGSTGGGGSTGAARAGVNGAVPAWSARHGPRVR